MSNRVQVVRATLTNVSSRGSKPIEVHFNPGSLQITVTKLSKQEGRNDEKTQDVGMTSRTLAMDLIFDTTDTGQDVRGDTARVAAFMEAVDPNAKTLERPVVLFRWGTFTFQGVMESYTETIDFFSPDGVPLRSTVKISFKKQKNIVAPRSTGSSRAAAPDAVEAPVGADTHVTQVAQQAGDQGTSGRWVAVANNLETMRFPSGPLTIDIGVSLSPPTPFASGDGLGLALNGGASLSVGASLGGAGPTFGGSASAGVSASAGAFAGLRATPTPQGTRGALDAMRLLGGPASAAVATRGQATFRLGGAANLEGAASLATDVGAASRIQFSGE
jgi:contractile injection system tube protein